MAGRPQSEDLLGELDFRAPGQGLRGMRAQQGLKRFSFIPSLFRCVSASELCMDMNSRITLVVGGTRSGKSAYAERLALENAGPRYYLATADSHPDDPELGKRIRVHQERRVKQGWQATVEQSRDLVGLFSEAPQGSTWLFECLPLWLAANAFQENGVIRDESWARVECQSLTTIWRERQLRVVVVSTESGLGMLPLDPIARRWIDLLGALNQEFAAVADEAWLCSCGIPLKLK